MGKGKAYPVFGGGYEAAGVALFDAAIYWQERGLRNANKWVLCNDWISLAFAQMALETADFTSPLWINNGNPVGMGYPNSRKLYQVPNSFRIADGGRKLARYENVPDPVGKSGLPIPIGIVDYVGRLIQIGGNPCDRQDIVKRVIKSGFAEDPNYWQKWRDKYAALFGGEVNASQAFGTQPIGTGILPGLGGPDSGLPLLLLAAIAGIIVYQLNKKSK